MAKYKCNVCGLIYDSEKGEPDSGFRLFRKGNVEWEDYREFVEPGTPFEKLPESWVCPDCGATKDHFEKIA